MERRAPFPQNRHCLEGVAEAQYTFRMQKTPGSVFVISSERNSGLGKDLYLCKTLESYADNTELDGQMV